MTGGLRDFTPSAAKADLPAMEAHLLGRLDFEEAENLQRHVLGRIAERDDGQIALLVCEHEPIITVGRDGSAAQVGHESRLVRAGRVALRWVGRGGGCLVHCPGQLAVYPIVPLWWYRWTVGEYLRRLRQGIVQTLESLRLVVRPSAGEWCLWGRSGRVAALGVAVRRWVTWHGAFINVCPPMGLFRLIEPRPETQNAGWGCLLAEQRRPVRMSAVRSALVSSLAEAFGCRRYHLHSSHPWLARQRRLVRHASHEGSAASRRPRWGL